jgi:hypothetical protein
MDAVVSFHSSLRLGRTCSNECSSIKTSPLGGILLAWTSRNFTRIFGPSLG